MTVWAGGNREVFTPTTMCPPDGVGTTSRESGLAGGGGARQEGRTGRLPVRPAPPCVDGLCAVHPGDEIAAAGLGDHLQVGHGAGRDQDLIAQEAAGTGIEETADHSVLGAAAAEAV